MTLPNSKPSFNKKTKRTIKQRKTTRMPYIWFWVHWFAEYAPKSVKHHFTKLSRLTSRDSKQEAKIISKWLFLTRNSVLTKKTKSAIKRRKRPQMPYIWFWVHWLAKHAPNSVQYEFTKLGRLTAVDPKEGAKNYWNFFFLSRK